MNKNITQYFLGDRVSNNAGVEGTVEDFDNSTEYSIGVLFDDVDDDMGIWWTKEADISKVGEVSYKEHLLHEFTDDDIEAELSRRKEARFMKDIEQKLDLVSNKKEDVLSVDVDWDMLGNALITFKIKP